MEQEKKEKIYWTISLILFGLITIVMSMYLSYKNLNNEKFSLGYIAKNIFTSAFFSIVILFPSQLILRFFIKKSKLKIDSGIGVIVGLMMFALPYCVIVQSIIDFKIPNKSNHEIIFLAFYIENSILFAILTRFIYKKMFDSSRD